MLPLEKPLILFKIWLYATGSSTGNYIIDAKSVSGKTIEYTMND